jgi:hypothetical protein
MTDTRPFALPLALVFAVACGGASSSPLGSSGDAPDSGASEAAVAGEGGTPQPGDDAAPPGDGATPDASATTAVLQTIATDAACTAIASFYWEIGDVTGPLASGSVGTGFDATTEMNIASASKMIFGAYVIERFKSDLTQVDASLMRMLGGYTGFDYDTCLASPTVSACATTAKNATITPGDVGDFYYSGGNFQAYAAGALGLGGDTDAQLATDIKALVGTELAFTYSSPQLAGGIHTSASDYAVFLRKVLAGTLALHDHLGENAVCTLPGASCPTAVYSPAAPYAWHYSYAHWVEDDPTSGDGAFSSAGAFGFYPWIDRTKTYYGIVARYSLDSGAYIQSAQCGAAIRKAFTSGTAQ